MYDTDTATLDFPPIDEAALAPSAPAPAPVSAPAPAADAAPPAQPAAELADIATVIDGQALVRYSRTEAALVDLRERYAGKQFDLTTTAGNAAARAARLELKTLRTALEKRRKELKAPALDFSAKIDAEAKRITAEIVAIEGPIDAQIVADEARREAERQERERLAAERRATFEAQIAKIRSYVDAVKGSHSTRVQKTIDFVEGLSFGPEWAEFASAAAAAQGEALAALQRLLESAQASEKAKAEAEALAAAQEAERVRLAAERAELERERAEIARQRAEIEAAQAAQREAAARAEREAREAVERQEAQARAQADAEAARVAADAELASLTKYTEGQDSQQVLKAEPETADATDRDVPAMASPGVGPMGAGQAADAALTLATAPPCHQTQVVAEPVAAPVAAPAPEPLPQITIGDINARLGFTVTAAFLESLGLKPLETTGRAVRFPGEDWADIKAAIVAHVGGLQ